MKYILVLLFALVAPLAHAQTLPGAPFSCVTQCTMAVPEPGTGPITLPAAPFTCQGTLTAPATVFSTPALPGVALSPNVVCSAPPTRTLPSGYTCNQVCTTPTNTDPLPVVTPVTFTIASPATLDEAVGTLTVSNGPITGLTIVSGDPGNASLVPPGYFGVYPITLHLRTTEIYGFAVPPSGTYTLMIAATNAAGTGAPAAITVVVQ